VSGLDDFSRPSRDSCLSFSFDYSRVRPFSDFFDKEVFVQVIFVFNFYTALYNTLHNIVLRFLLFHLQNRQ
jgi:hypothetical protein